MTRAIYICLAIIAGGNIYHSCGLTPAFFAVLFFAASWLLLRQGLGDFIADLREWWAAR